jgi:hypothetical protein
MSELLDTLRAQARLEFGPREEAPASAPAPAPAPTPASDHAPAPASRASLVLYIDCRPIKGAGDLLLLSDLLQPAAAEVCRIRDKAHWRLCDYGTGEGELAAAARPALEQLTGRVFVDSSLPECRAVMAYLIERATGVVMAVR